MKGRIGNMTKGTKTTLVRDLKAIVSVTPTGEKRNFLWRIIAGAERGNYHDFESELDTPFPKMELHKHLLQLDTPEALAIDKKMQQGEYDDSPFPEDESKNN